MSDRGPDVPRETAREKLAAFERKNRAQRSNLVRLFALLLVLLVALIAVFFMSRMSGSDWYGLPKDAAWMIREGRLVELEKLLAPDFEIVGRPELDREGVLAALREGPVGGRFVYTTAPEWGEHADGNWLVFYAVRSLGDVTRPTTPPFVDVWSIQARVVEIEGEWRFRSIEARRVETRPRELREDVREVIEGLGR